MAVAQSRSSEGAQWSGFSYVIKRTARRGPGEDVLGESWQTLSSGGNANKPCCLLHVTLCPIPVFLSALLQPQFYKKKMLKTVSLLTLQGKTTEKQEEPQVFLDCTEFSKTVFLQQRLCCRIPREGVSQVEAAGTVTKLSRMQSSLAWDSLFTALLPFCVCLLCPRLQPSDRITQDTGHRPRDGEREAWAICLQARLLQVVPGLLQTGLCWVCAVSLLFPCASVLARQLLALRLRVKAISCLEQAVLLPAQLEHYARFYYYSMY